MKDKTEFLQSFRRRPVKEIIGDKEIHLLPLSRGDTTEILSHDQPGRQVGLTAVRSICTPEGTRLFNDNEVDEYRNWLSISDQDKIYAAIRKLNGWEDEPGKVPEPTTPNKTFSSGSPAISE